jgi:hypothetical protein
LAASSPAPVFELAASGEHFGITGDIAAQERELIAA